MKAKELGTAMPAIKRLMMFNSEDTKRAIKLAPLFEEILKKYEEINEIRMTFIDKHCKKDRKGNNIQHDGVYKIEDIDAFTKEVGECLDYDLKFSGKIPFALAEEAKVSSYEIIDLGDLLEQS